MDVAFATQVHVKCEKIVFRMFFFNCFKNGECCSLRRFHLVIGMLSFIPEIFTCISTLINRNVLKF